MFTHDLLLWTPESEYDKETVKNITEKIISFYNISEKSILTIGKKAIQTKIKGKLDPANAFSTSIQHYLEEAKYIIFILDKDGIMTSANRQKEENSLINQVNRIVRDTNYKDRVFCVLAIEELEAWLLVDCQGIFCYFAENYPKFKNNCRSCINLDQKLIKFVNKYQKGNTELIVEAESGGKSAKEYLIEYSEKILHFLNKNLKKCDIDKRKYHEANSCDIAKHIEIDKCSLNRNNSLLFFSDLLNKIFSS